MNNVNFHTALYMINKSTSCYLKEYNNNPSNKLHDLSQTLTDAMIAIGDYSNINYNFYPTQLLKDKDTFVLSKEEMELNYQLKKDVYYHKNCVSSFFNSFDDWYHTFSIYESLYFSNLLRDKDNNLKEIKKVVISEIEYKNQTIIIPEYRLMKIGGKYYYLILCNDSSYESFKHLCNKYGLHYLFGIFYLGLKKQNTNIFLRDIKILFIDKNSPHIFNEFNNSGEALLSVVENSLDLMLNIKNNPISYHHNSYNLTDDLSINMRPS